jgi:hypothetical protein
MLEKAVTGFSKELPICRHFEAMSMRIKARHPTERLDGVRREVRDEPRSDEDGRPTRALNAMHLLDQGQAGMLNGVLGENDVE